MRTALERTARDLDADVAALRRLLGRLPFLQVIGNLVAAATADQARGTNSLPMPLALEYVTWLYLSSTESIEIDGRPILGDDFERLLTLLPRVLTESLFATMDQLHREPDQGLAELRLRAQTHDAYIRQTAYPAHLRDQGHALFEPFEADLRRLGMVPFDMAADILAAVIEIVTAQLGEQQARVRDVHEQWAPAVDDPEARAALDAGARRLIDRHGRDTPAVVALWGIFGLADCYHVDASSIAAATGIDASDVAAFFEAFSLPFGQPVILGGRPGLYEPLRSAPFVRMPDRRYLSHLAPYLQWTIRERYDDALSSDATVGESYRDHRAGYLEQQAVRLLASTSTHAETLAPAFYWFDDGDGRKRYEIDGLVFIDSVLFVIEAKAGRLSARGRRGGDLPELRRLVADAQAQAARVERYIRSTRPAVFETHDGQRVAVVADTRARVILVNPTLEPLHAFVTRWSDLEAAGIALAKPWVWSISVTDLRAIVETVETAGQLAHFLQRRLELEDLNVVAAEELDLFGHYLDRGLYLEEVRRDRPDLASIGSWTDALDAHFERGEPAPRMALPDVVRDLIHRLATVGPPRWIEATRLVLDGSSEALEILAQSVIARRARVASGAVDVSMARFGMGDEMLAYMACKTLERDKLEVYVAAIRRYHRVSRVIGIAEVEADPAGVTVCIDDETLLEDSDADAAARAFVEAMSSTPLSMPRAAPPPSRTPRSQRRAEARLRGRSSDAEE